MALCWVFGQCVRWREYEESECAQAQAFDVGAVDDAMEKNVEATPPTQKKLLQLSSH